MEKGFEATCLITGAKDNLRMHAFRNKSGEMIGWVFVHKDHIDQHEVVITYEAKLKESNEPETDRQQ